MGNPVNKKVGDKVYLLIDLEWTQVKIFEVELLCVYLRTRA